METTDIIGSCWIITEGMAGTENQCLGVADALGVAPVVKRVSLRQPWKTLSPYLKGEQGWIFTPSLNPPWPDLLITSGRKSAAAARYVKKMSGGKTFTVQIQDPRIAPNNFDLLSVPEHDPTRGENVIVTTAAPNRVTDEILDEATKKFAYLSSIKQPRVAVLIGGSSKAHTMTPEVMRQFAEHLKKIQGGLMITASRRTDAESMKVLKESLPGATIWDGTGENPYFGFLAWADFIVVTADSVSMISEAATTGKPVYVMPLPGGARRLNKFLQNLDNKGIIRQFRGKLEEWRYEPLRDAEKTAGEIKKRLKMRE